MCKVKQSKRGRYRDTGMVSEVGVWRAAQVGPYGKVILYVLSNVHDYRSSVR